MSTTSTPTMMMLYSARSALNTLGEEGEQRGAYDRAEGGVADAA